MTSDTPREVDRLRRLLRSCWSRATSTLWSDENPARGQCGVTALVVHDRLGGEIVKTRVGEVWHFYNRVGGTRYDLTAEQFDRAPDYLDLPAGRTEALADTNEEQYAALSAALASALQEDRLDEAGG
jgi:hypothetical protein